MHSEIRKTFKDIKSMKVQGATDVALEAVKALKHVENEEDLDEAIRYLKGSRPTEPMMRNGLKYVRENYQEGKVEQIVEEFEDMVDESIEKITRNGAEFIPEEAVVITHCHSGLVENILTEAYSQGKLEKVIVTETRPRYQGRTTAKNLADKDIPITVVVDSARRQMVDKADLALVGADVITSDGHLINKIGTYELSLSIEETDKEFLVASELLKIDPMTLKGKREKIEERAPEEVWENPPEGVDVTNLAFDSSPPDQIDYVVTEEGIINPFNVINNVRRKYPWVMEASL